MAAARALMAGKNEGDECDQRLKRSTLGELAEPKDIRRLADEYRKAADLLLPLARRGEAMSRAPYRLSAIQAIELYLSALLLHDPAARAELAIAGGLQLRKRTTAHLSAMTGNREISRNPLRPRDVRERFSDQPISKWNECRCSATIIGATYRGEAGSATENAASAWVVRYNGALGASDADRLALLRQRLAAVPAGTIDRPPWA